MQKMSRQPLFALVTVCLVLAFAPGRALGQGQLVPIVTNDTLLPLPDQFGQQSTVARNQAGDVAVLDAVGSAVHLKTNGSPTWARVVQAGDEVPGLPGSRIHAIVALQINASGLLAMGVELNLSSGEQQVAIVIYNGASLVNVVDGTDIAPNSGGARFGLGLTLRRLNDAGSVVVTIPAPGQLPNPDQVVVFLVPNGGAPVRIAGVGDSAPGTALTFLGLEVSGFNANGEVLVTGFLGGGSGEFIGTTTELRKVVAFGDANPLGGTFVAVGNGMLNNLGQMVFTGIGGGGSGLFRVESNSTITRIFATGTAAPVPMGGTLGTPLGFAHNDAGFVLFDAQVLSNPTTSQGIFRLTPGGAVETVLYRNQPAPGSAPGSVISQFSLPTMNASGQAAFRAAHSNGSTFAYYFQAGTGPLVPLIVHGGPSTVPDGGTAVLSGSVLGPIFDDGNTLIHLSVLGGTTDFAYFVRHPGSVTSMILTTSDDLPAGGQALLSQRGSGVRGSGGFVSFIGMRPGGGIAVLVYDAATAVTTRVAGDGDPVQGTGERFRIAITTPLFVNSAGQVALTGFFHGTVVRDGIALASAGGGVQEIATRDASSGPLFSSLHSPPLVPSGLNSSGQVPFFAIDGLLETLRRGVWVGVAGAPPTSAMKDNDPTTDGAPVSNLTAALAINEAGEVLARASVLSRLLLATPGGPIREVVASGDAAPGGGTFGGFTSASLNNVGQVAFEASTTGAGGGVFVASTSAPPVAVALNGAAAPGGGTFAIASSGPNVVINDQGDVLFRAGLTGAAADSGRFLRRGSVGAIQSLVRQGDAAPGTAFAFSTVGPDSATGAGQQLSAGGGVTFRGDYFDGSGTVSNYWHMGVNGAVEPVALSVPAAFGGGTVVRTSPTSSWAGGAYPIWARVSGGSFAEGVFLFIPSTAVNVGIGSGIQVTPMDEDTRLAPVTVTFETVTGAGAMALTMSTTGPALPAGYAPGTPSRFYDLTTTATSTGAIAICVNVNDVTFPPGSALRLLHFTSGVWSDVTTTVAGKVACGSVTSLSVFTVARLTAPGPNLVQNGDFSGGLASWLAFATPDSSYIQAAVNGGVLEYFRVPPPPGETNQAVIFQRTGVALESGTPLVAAFDLGNSSSVRKRISVLVQDTDFSDLSVCTFWLPPNLALTTYEIRTHTTRPWTDVTIAFYAGTPGSDGGAYQIDNVSLRAVAEGAIDRTECVDPTRPVPPGGPDGPTLLVNGDFEAGLPPPWGLFGHINAQVFSGVLWFQRTSVTPPAGVVLQPTGQTATAGEIFTAAFEFSSTYSTRRRVTVLIHDNDFTDLAACTFWLEPGQALQPYQMRTFATKAWTNATVSIYPATADTSGWLRVDNVTFSRTPGATFSGTDCVEPASSSAAGAYRHSSGLITNDSAMAAMTKNANTVIAVLMAMRRGF
jgi:hypothetical protein